ncbi:MAG TPA: tRNA guanosine(15) transglycosylase TgtA [Thermoplasmata archaeon]|nr:tRNA guanosine(15) transglycosylase TgtA [Thermoplasmata archaeon]
MSEFEVLERDGLARLGKLPTPHGTISTPALLPVVHPDPARQPIPAAEIQREFGFPGVITSSYIAWRNPELRERALAVGLHELLGFHGPVMTDSGAFQQHAYGSVEVDPNEILDFQSRIRSDIATVLDVFIEPTADQSSAARGIQTTADRARAARERRTGLLAVPVQGGLFPELREESARTASELGDVLAVGGVVPLLEQYRYAALAQAILAARPGLVPQHPVHLFGAGHPMVFAFAALLGVDLFDSSSYHKFARRGAVLFPEGTVAIETIREPICGCKLCAVHPLPDVARMPPAEREGLLARHNLWTCANEMARVRQAIRDGMLWELAERRAAAHPALLAGLKSVVRGARVLAPAEPVARVTFRASSPLSTLRPSVIRFLARLRHYRTGRGAYRIRARVALTSGSLRHVPATGPDGVPILWECPTPVGPVPLELTDVYPVGCWVGPDEFEEPPAATAGTADESATPADPDAMEIDWTEAWTGRQIAALLEWQYGTDAVPMAARMTGERSRQSGRLRAALGGTGHWFIFGPGAVARPTWKGAQELHRILPFPRARIVVDPDAAPFVASGKSLFSKFVRGGDSSLCPDAPALLVDPDDRLLAVGRLLLAPYEMAQLRRGVAVGVTANARTAPELPESTVDPSSTIGYG